MKTENERNESAAESGVDSSALFGTWTPLSVGLPKYMRAVLVWAPQHENAYCAYYYFYNGSNDPIKKPIWAFFDNDGCITPVREEITHWMPLPSPPNSQDRLSRSD